MEMRTRNACSTPATAAMLDRWRNQHPQVETAQVSVDPHLEPFTCVVESELGRIEAGLPAQLEAVRDRLSAAAVRTELRR